MAAAFAPPPLPKLRPLTSLERGTARQVVTSSLRKADFLAEGHVQALADGILLDLEEHGLEIVTREDVE
jgi:phytoene dehydrogenase-like protein